MEISGRKGQGQSRRPCAIAFVFWMVVFCYSKGRNTLGFDCIWCPAYHCSRNPAAKCPWTGTGGLWDCPFMGIALFPTSLQLISFIHLLVPYLSAFCAALSVYLHHCIKVQTRGEFFPPLCTLLWFLLYFLDLFLCPLCPGMIISAFQTPCKEQKGSSSSQVLQQFTFFFFLPTLIHSGQVWFFYL